MTRIVAPGSGLLYMKVGTHAQEPLEEIVRRKRKEIDDAGYALWGYGGPTCHPTNAVQPFAREYERKGGVIYLCMQEMVSKHFAITERAKEMSVDGCSWKLIPPAINVKGSRYAMVIKTLQQEQFDISLANTRVAIGNHKGRAGDKFIAGRVDKACLEMAEQDNLPSGDDPLVEISLVAEVVSPYAVFVRN